MKFLISVLCIIYISSTLSMGHAVQQLGKARHADARSHRGEDGNAILTGLGIATMRAIQYLSCPCYPDKQLPKRKKAIGKSTKAE